MQSLSWYARRLRSMSPAEIAWRARSLLRDAADRVLLRSRQRRLRGLSFSEDAAAAEPPFRVTDMAVGEWAADETNPATRMWYGRLMARADRIVDHRLSVFDLPDCHLGHPIDWNRDHKSGKKCPMRFSSSIDYRDFDAVGDAKFVWEPNRHHQFVVLGRAYRASGDVRYAEALVEQLDGWIEQCPYGLGMNWRSPLELAVRLINWVWAVDLIRESGLVRGSFRDRLLRSTHAHIWEIARKYSRGSSANNHRVGEAAGVFIAASYFRMLEDTASRRAESREILCEEIRNQTYPDGGNREQAYGYHLFVLQFFLLAGLVGRWCGDDFPSEYWSLLEKMFEFAGAMIDGGGSPPMFGDSDDGYVLDVESGPPDVRSLLSVGATLFGRSDFKAWSGGYSEPARMLMGKRGAERYDAIADLPPESRIVSKAFPQSGYYLLQSGHRDSRDRISVVFDCGELGFKSIAAHGHADALSFTLRAFGADVLVDAGTYDYFTHPRWRAYFRSTPAHNTVTVDGLDQSEMVGPFMWGARAHATCTCWEPSEWGGCVEGEHDGYTRLRDPVIHRRRMELNARNGELLIRDRLSGKGRHNLAVYFHLAEGCKLVGRTASLFEADVAGGRIALELDPQMTCQVVSGGDESPCGWYSRAYHNKVPCQTIVGTCASNGTVDLFHRLLIIDSERGTPVGWDRHSKRLLEANMEH